MKYTLLEMTQAILSDMDSDEVNSITDTAESKQIASIIKETYYNIIARADLPELQQTFSLNASGDSALPVIMTKPSNITRIDWIKYFNTDNAFNEYLYVTIIPFQQFLDETQRVDAALPNIDSLTFNGNTYYFNNDGQPSKCTIISNYTILFDAYNHVIDTSTLQSSKTLCFGQTIPTFTISDNFTPTLDDQQFPLFLNEAKSACFLQLKQISNDTSEREAKRQWHTLQRTKKLANKPSDFDQLTDFGRGRSDFGRRRR